MEAKNESIRKKTRISIEGRKGGRTGKSRKKWEDVVKRKSVG